MTTMEKLLRLKELLSDGEWSMTKLERTISNVAEFYLFTYENSLVEVKKALSDGFPQDREADKLFTDLVYLTCQETINEK